MWVAEKNHFRPKEKNRKYSVTQHLSQHHPKSLARKGEVGKSPIKDPPRILGTRQRGSNDESHPQGAGT